MELTDIDSSDLLNTNRISHLQQRLDRHMGRLKHVIEAMNAKNMYTKAVKYLHADEKILFGSVKRCCRVSPPKRYEIPMAIVL